MDEKLKEGTRVFHKSENYSFIGEIVGLSGSEQAIIGITYIIKILEVCSGKIDCYDYSCLTLPRIMFEVIKL
jgi:hypothetical protein